MLTPPENGGEPEGTGQPQAPDPESGPDTASAALTPEQVARALGGTIIARYPAAGQRGPVRYGPHDAAAALARAGHRVALRSGVYYVDSEPVTPEKLAQLAAGLEPGGTGSTRPGR